MREITDTYFFLNDELLPANDFESGFLNTGLNVYEVLRFYEITPLFFEQHFARLLLSAKGKNLCVDLHAASLKSKTTQLLKLSQENEGNLKIVLHSESQNNCDVYIYHIPHHYPSRQDYKNGVKIISLKESRPDPNLKNWRPVFRKKVSQLKTDYNAFEILLVDERGNIREGSQSNFFAIFGDKVVTSNGGGVLKGITRECIFQICREEKIQITEEDFSLSDLESADTVFLTGTSPKVLPISKIDKLSFSTENAILQTFIKKYNHIINHYINRNK